LREEIINRVKLVALALELIRKIQSSGERKPPSALSGDESFQKEERLF